MVLQGKQSKAMADQLTTVSKWRLINHEDSLTNANMRWVAHAVKVQLDLLATPN
jgi:mRNA-degrading endonuclease toxin of MazEF toxin-antitoxin module